MIDRAFGMSQTSFKFSFQLQLQDVYTANIATSKDSLKNRKSALFFLILALGGSTLYAYGTRTPGSPISWRAAACGA